MQYQYTSMDRIFSKFSRDITDIFSEDDLVEQTGEALEFIHAPKSYEPYVAFIEVNNHQCAIPTGTHNIIQIGRNNTWSREDKSCMCPEKVQECLNSPSSQDDEDCNITLDTAYCGPQPSDAVWIDCDGKPIVAYDLAYYRPFFNLKLESFNTFSNNHYYRRAFTPVRLSTNSMFSSLVCNDDKPNPYFNSRYTSNHNHHSKDEYTIVQRNTLRFSFREGAIAVAYTRQMLDPNTGFPMIPDEISYITAITKYITMKKFEKEFYAGRDGAKNKLDKAESDWQWYCGQASNNEKMPYGEDEYQNLLDQRQHMLPVTNSYYGFFGNLNSPEHRVWNNRFGSNNNAIYIEEIVL